VPALVIILISFGLILLLLRYKVPLYVAAIAAVLALGLIARQGPARGMGIAGEQLGATITDPDVISLLIIIVLILLFSTILRLSGRLEVITNAFDKLVRIQSSGSRLSRRLLGCCRCRAGHGSARRWSGHRRQMWDERPGQLAAINYWFRHIWEYWWPLYPGVLLASGLAGISLPLIVALMIPVSVFVTVIGMAMMFRDLKLNGNVEQHREKGCARQLPAFIVSMWPILAVVVGGVCLEMAREVYEAHGGVFPQPAAAHHYHRRAGYHLRAGDCPGQGEPARPDAPLADKRELELSAMVFSGALLPEHAGQNRLYRRIGCWSCSSGTYLSGWSF